MTGICLATRTKPRSPDEPLFGSKSSVMVYEYPVPFIQPGEEGMPFRII